MSRPLTQDEIDDEMLAYDDEIDEGGSEFDDLLDECALGPDGQCGHAGSEHCDFVCPMRDSEHFAGSAAWRKKHGQ